ncbi:MFS general substrate transporter [Serendipita vermifera]|nr:MFS general substrate transporter [Serendipita vermifera]
MENTKAAPPKDGKRDDISSVASENGQPEVKTQSQDRSLPTHDKSDVVNADSTTHELNPPLSRDATTPAHNPKLENTTSTEDFSTTSPPASRNVVPTTNFDNIETVPVRDDPRKWSASRKWMVLFIVSFASLAPSTAAMVFQPAIELIQDDLRASTNEIALTLSLFIVVQGAAPLLWSAISEIKGRKAVYIVSLVLFTIGSAVAASTKSIAVFISMRIFQAAGSSAVPAIGAGTLADIYAPKERATMMGIYYAAPLLGPSLGMLLGGVLAQIWRWRATFYFMVIIGGVVLIALCFFRDTFRKERSLTYRAAKEHALKRRQRKQRKKQRSSSEVGMAEQRIGTKEEPDPSELDNVKVRITDLNIIKPIIAVLKRKNNFTIYFSSGILFGLQYTICFTAARTLSKPPYNYDPLHIGLVMLAFGGGNMIGSILGGRWSDKKYAMLRKANKGEGWPEMRFRSTFYAMFALPPSLVGYGWTSEKHVHIAAQVVLLFIAGFSLLFVYSSTLAYIVDANAGRSTAAVATNSLYRGLSALIAAEIAAPIQDAISDGGLYSAWGAATVVVEILIIVVAFKGKKWREEAEKKEKVFEQDSSNSHSPS